MATSHVDRIMEEGRNEGRQEGREEGREEGTLLARQETLLRQLNKRFGTLPIELVSRIQGTTSIELLDAALDQVLDASRLDESRSPAHRNPRRPLSADLHDLDTGGMGPEVVCSRQTKLRDLGRTRAINSMISSEPPRGRRRGDIVRGLGLIEEGFWLR